MSFSFKNDSEKSEQDRYLKLQEGLVRVRFLDEEPLEKWTHWINNKPLNCPGPKNGCPACVVNRKAKAEDPKSQAVFKLQKTKIINVAVYGDRGVTPEVKILAVASSLGDALQDIVQEYGDVRDYDVKIKKSKSGPKIWDVRYGATKASDDFWKTEFDVLRENRFDLAPEIVPAKPADIAAAMRGTSETEDNVSSVSVSEETLTKLREGIKKHEQGVALGLVDFGIDEKTLTEKEALDYIKELC